MKRVLVTGATGFIGRHCLQPLLDRGFEVHAVTLDGSVPCSTLVKWHRFDLLSTEGPASLMEDLRPTHLLHFAWNVEPNQYWMSLENAKWLDATIRLLQTFAAAGGRRMTLAGTCAEYDWSHSVLHEATTPSAPATLYGACKHAARLATDLIAEQSGVSHAWGRIFFPFGPHEHPDRLISSVIRALLEGRTAECTHGNQVRDFMYVEDVAGAFVALLESDVKGVVNIASGRPLAIRELVTMIGTKLGRADLVRLGVRPTPPNEPPWLEADVRRLRSEVGWTDIHDLDQALDRTIEWWKGKTP